MRSLRAVFWEWLWHRRGNNNDNIAVTGRDVSEEVIEKIYADISRKLQLNSSDVVLDVGCASGVFDIAISRQVQWVTAVDKFPSMVSRAKKNFEGIENIETICCDAYKIPKKGKCFSKVLCYGVIQYVQSAGEIKKILCEFHRVLQDDGLLLLGDIPDPFQALVIGVYEENNLLMKAKHAIYKIMASCYREEEILDICRDAGFKARVVAQPQGLPLYNSRFDLILTKQAL